MKEITVILFCSLKFAMTFPYAIYGLNMSFWETILYTNIGGLIGLLVSVYLSKFILWLWNKYITPKLRQRKKKKRIFTRRNRRLILLKTRYGFAGIVVLTPILFSIPIGSFLMTKYYGIKIKNIFWMLLGQISWSFLYAIFYFYIRSLFFNT